MFGCVAMIVRSCYRLDKRIVVIYYVHNRFRQSILLYIFVRQRCRIEHSIFVFIETVSKQRICVAEPILLIVFYYRVLILFYQII